jgi:uncharacterized membrane protein YqjE
MVQVHSAVVAVVAEQAHLVAQVVVQVLGQIRSTVLEAQAQQAALALVLLEEEAVAQCLTKAMVAEVAYLVNLVQLVSVVVLVVLVVQQVRHLVHQVQQAQYYQAIQLKLVN